MLEYETSPTFRAVARAFVKAESGTKFPPGPGLAMWATESGWGQFLTGDFNYFGITRNPEDGPAKFVATHEDITPAELASFRPDERATAVKGADLGSGKFSYSMFRWFASYASMDDAVQHFIALFTQSPDRYKNAWKQYLADCGKYPTLASITLLRAIGKAGYSTGDAERTEEEIAAQANVQHAIQMARAEASTAATQSV